METHLQRLQSDLHKCVNLIQDPKKLKDSVQTIYARYVPQPDEVSGARSLLGAETELTLVCSLA